MVLHGHVSRILVPVIIALLTGCSHLPGLDNAVCRDPYLSMIKARHLENQGDYAGALRHYDCIDDPYARLAEARINFILNRDQQVINLTTALIDDGTYPEDALEMRTKAYMRTGKWDLAVNDAEAYLSLRPEDPGMQLMLANMYLRNSRTASARMLLEKLLLSEKANHSAVYYALARVCLAEHNLDCACNELIRTIEGNPDFLAAYRDLGRVYRMLGRQEDAEDVYQKLLEQEPFSVDAHNDLAAIYIEQGRYADALVHVRTLIEIEASPRLFRQLILLELQEGLFAEVLQRLKEYPAKTAEDYYLMAVAHTGRREWNAALRILDTIGNDPETNCDAVLLKASILEDTGRTPAALQTMLEAWNGFGQAAGCFDLGYELALALEKNGRRREGLDVALRLIEIQPNNPAALNFVGYLWAEQGSNLEQARTMIARALEIQPDDGYILDSMAWVLYRMGHFQKAFAFMEKALQIVEDDPVLNEHMGDILTAMGMPAKALDYYLKASVAVPQPNEHLRDKIRMLAQ